MADNGTAASHDTGSGSTSRRLRNGDERLRALVSSILSDTSDAVLLVDPDGTVLSGNAAAARLIGVRTRQLKGVKLGDLIENWSIGTLGLLLAAMAVQTMAEGLRELLPGLGG